MSVIDKIEAFTRVNNFPNTFIQKFQKMASNNSNQYYPTSVSFHNADEGVGSNHIRYSPQPLFLMVHFTGVQWWHISMFSWCL